MAPATTGNRHVDEARSMDLCEAALAIAEKNLVPGDSFVCKVFQGEGFDEFVRDARNAFGRVRVIKPDASRAASREVYLVARNFSL